MIILILKKYYYRQKKLKKYFKKNLFENFNIIKGFLTINNNILI